MHQFVQLKTGNISMKGGCFLKCQLHVSQEKKIRYITKTIMRAWHDDTGLSNSSVHKQRQSVSSRPARSIKWVSRPVTGLNSVILSKTKKNSLPDTFMLPSHLRTFLQVVSSSEKVRTTNFNCSVIADVRQWLRALCGRISQWLSADYAHGPTSLPRKYLLPWPPTTRPGMQQQLRQACPGDGTSADISEESYNQLLAWN